MDDLRSASAEPESPGWVASAPSPAPTAVTRVTRVRLPATEFLELRPALLDFYRRSVPQWRGLFAHWIGLTEAGPDVLITAVSGWEDHESQAAAQRRDQRVLMRGLFAGLSDAISVEHWTLLDQLASSFEPGAGSVLRLLRFLPAPQNEVDVARQLMASRAAFVAEGDLSVTQLARRDGPDGVELLLVNIWRDRATLEARVAGGGLAWGILAGMNRLAGPIEIEQYDLQDMGVLRMSPDGPALLITDDEGLIVDVTPRAASLLATDPWVLLGRRLADIHAAGVTAAADGAGLPGVFSRPSGGAMVLHARHASDVPVPGRHATLLVPGSEGPPSDDVLRAALQHAYRREGSPA